MRSARLITLKRERIFLFYVLPSVLIFLFSDLRAQDNSPYSRYGLGDLSPSTNITTRGMGGISSGYSDVLSINFANPASYSAFQTFIEQKSRKVSSGRVILDVGMNFDNRTLTAPNTTNHFASADALFSYIQVGLPIRKNWGLSFGLRPISRISYNISQNKRLMDPITGNPIDSTSYEYSGSGGSYLASIGTGFAIRNLSLGFNVGYLFGRKESTSRITFLDSVIFNAGNFSSSGSFGNIFFNAGLQYKIDLNKHNFIRLGFSGNWQQNINTSQDIIRQTFVKPTTGDIQQIDSVYAQNGVAGKIIFPSSYKAGFIIQHVNDDGSGWLFGSDYSESKWSNYRFMGLADSVQDNWQISLGGQIFPKANKNYFSKVAYRFGFYTGPDYIRVMNKLNQLGFSFGLGLPIANYNRLSPNQYSILNLSFEYGKRGSNINLLKENMFRISVGFNFTDLWFGKRKYD